MGLRAIVWAPVWLVSTDTSFCNRLFYSHSVGFWFSGSKFRFGNTIFGEATIGKERSIKYISKALISSDPGAHSCLIGRWVIDLLEVNKFLHVAWGLGFFAVDLLSDKWTRRKLLLLVLLILQGVTLFLHFVAFPSWSKLSLFFFTISFHIFFQETAKYVHHWKKKLTTWKKSMP